MAGHRLLWLGSATALLLGALLAAAGAPLVGLFLAAVGEILAIGWSAKSRSRGIVAQRVEPVPGGLDAALSSGDAAAA